MGVCAIDNVFIVKNDSETFSADAGDSIFRLLMRRDGIEIMRFDVDAKSCVWLSPADDKTAMEFFCLLSGSLNLCLDDGDVKLGVGDSFYVEGLGKDIRIFADTDTQLLYITSKPMFDYIIGYKNDFDDLLTKIDGKDHVTRLHSKNVLMYVTRIFGELGELVNGLVFDDLATATLFHDVGKCMIPDEILKKEGKLTPEEYAVMKKHPEYSAAMLSSKFGDNVCGPARWHHERLDGSGYPDGLSGDEIPLGARIIAVADSFDAMTAFRTYSKLKEPIQAAKELCEQSDKYDEKVSAALLRLVERDSLGPEEKSIEK